MASVFLKRASPGQGSAAGPEEPTTVPDDTMEEVPEDAETLEQAPDEEIIERAPMLDPEDQPGQEGQQQ